MDYRDIQKLVVFFSAFKDSGFKQNIAQIPSFATIAGQRTPVDKSYCLSLLRKFPQFQGDKFKDDNALLKYLSDPNNRKFLLGNFTQAQQVELSKVLAEKPAAAEVAGGQPSGEATSTEQGVSAQTPAGTATGMPGLPSIPSVSSSGQRIYRVPPTPEPPKAETPQPASQRFNIRSFKTPNFVKNFSSNTQIFAKNNLGKIAGGFGNMLKRAGRGFGSPLLNGAYNALGGIGTGGLRAFGRISNIPRPRLGGITNSSLKSSGSKKLLWGLALGIFFFVFVGGIIGGITGNTPSGEAAPVSSTGVNGVDYTLPLRNPSISVQDIREQIKQIWPNAQIDNWQLIIDQAKLHNWNPAVLLTLWIEESGAQGVSASDPLGCDVRKPTTDIQISLGCFFNSFDNKFTNDQFPQFLLTYSSPGDPIPFKTNPNFPDNFKYWYSKLVPTGIGATTAITSSTSYTPNGGAGIVSCPLNGVATITLGSKDAGGHCTPQYQAQEAPCLPGDPTGRTTAIDVQSSDKAVFLPTLGSQSADWTVDTTGTIIDGGINVGQDLAATASYNGRSYRIRFVHLDLTKLTVGNHYPSGTFVGYYRTAQNHVHVTLQEDGVFKDSDLYFNLCR